MENKTLTHYLQQNVEQLEVLFLNCGGIVKRKITVGGDYKTDIFISYADNMVDRQLLQEHVIQNLVKLAQLPAEKQFAYIKDHALESADIKEQYTFDAITQAIMSGDVALLIDGFDKALIISLRSYPNRGIAAVETEVTVRGAKDSFTEVAAFNKVLIRRRIKDTHLKMEPLQVGTRSRTDITVTYMDGIAQQPMVQELKKRINSFTIDGIFDIGMLEQLIESEWYSPFPQFQSTERPDKTASALLEGRIAILVDNSPMALLLPATLNSFFQASDDYYNRRGIVAFIRVLRYLAAFLSFCLPGLYVAVTNYQPELVPTSLALSFAAARQGVPFSILLEMIIMLISFELLTEAGIRLPSPMGNTIGIVGGLIIGDAAVNANLASPMAVIIVAATAIASFTIPNETFSSAFRLIKYPVLLFSVFLGLYGFVIGVMLVLIHLADLKSFGIPYLSPYVAADLEASGSSGDTIRKKPIFWLIYRPIYADPGQKRRLSGYRKENMK